MTIVSRSCAPLCLLLAVSVAAFTGCSTVEPVPKPSAAAPPAPQPAPLPPTKNIGYTNTPMIPGLPWHVHDGLRPVPRVVAPGA